jgi:hypothetical protein
MVQHWGGFLYVCCCATKTTMEESESREIVKLARNRPPIMWGQSAFQRWFAPLQS